MKMKTDQNAYWLHSETLVRQLVSDTFEVLEQYGLFKPEQNKELAHDLLYRLCAVLDGSSYPGTLADKEIAPFVGFYSTDGTESVLIPDEDGSGVRAFVGEMIEAYERD